jgi:SAM-dependent methyltransferase
MTAAVLVHAVRGWAVRAVGFANKVLFRGSEHECPVCGSRLRAFLPLPRVFRTELEVAGRKYTFRDYETLAVDEYLCPVCRSADRDRLAALHLRNVFAQGLRGGALLHFAPERGLARFLRRSATQTYRTADLYMPGVDDRVDITMMARYADASIDCFICSHVLEHVFADTQAMRELFRILRPGGWGIVMSPVLRGLERTIEDPSVTDPAERVRRFGQDDHVRVYSKGDFVRRLEGAGFRVEQLGVDAFGQAAFRRAGIDAGSCLYVVSEGAMGQGNAPDPAQASMKPSSETGATR